MIVNGFGEEVILVVAIPRFVFDGKTDKRVVIPELDHLIFFVGIEEVENVDIAEDVAGDEMEGSQRDREATFLDVARNAFLAAVNHRVAGSLDSASSLASSNPGPKDDFVFLFITDRHGLSQTHDVFAEVRIDSENWGGMQGSLPQQRDG